jgi:hypothetical protein
MALRLLQATSFLWAGSILAIALEARVKFNAPSVTRGIGLDVGRHVFGALNKAEIGYATVLLGTLLAGESGPEVRWAAGAVCAILALQTAWLLPTLQRQAKTIIDGGAAPETDHAHLGYIFLEVAKTAALLFIGWQALPA